MRSEMLRSRLPPIPHGADLIEDRSGTSRLREAGLYPMISSINAGGDTG